MVTYMTKPCMNCGKLCSGKRCRACYSAKGMAKFLGKKRVSAEYGGVDGKRN